MRLRERRQGWSLLVVELTSGVPLVAGVLLCLVSILVGAVVTTPSLLPGLADPLNAALTCCSYLGPAAAATAAAHTARLRRSGVLRIGDTSPQGRWRSWRLAALSSLLWAWAAWSTLLFVVLVTADLAGPRTLGMTVLAVQGTALVGVCSVAGSALGMRLASNWTPPGMAMAAYAVIYVLDRTSSGPLDRLSPVFTAVFYQNDRVPNAVLLAGLVALITGLGAGIMAVTAWSSRARRPGGLLGVVAMGLVILGAVGLVSAPAGDTQARTGGVAECRRQDGIELCVFSESAPRLASMADALARAYASAAPLFDAPTSYRQPQVSGAPPDAVPVDVPGNDEPGGELARAIAAVVPGAACVAPAVDYVEAMGLIYERLIPGSTGHGEIAEVARMPLEAQRRWIAPRIEASQQCRTD